MTVSELLDALTAVPAEFERDAMSAARAIDAARHPCEEASAIFKATRLLRRVRLVAAPTVAREA